MNLDLIAIRRDLHRHPEVAWCEYRTAAVVEAHLQSLGLAARRLAGTGVLAEVEGARPGPTVALRADMDALPVTEASGVAFASATAGQMHACGHDVHTAVALGVAEQLVARREQLQGKVRLLFQPAEEVTEGAQALIAEGALDGVAAVFGLHNAPFLPVGTIALRTGALFAASDRFRITIEGVGGHGAYPHLTRDPLVAGAAVLTGLQTAVSRSISPLEPAVVSVCRFAGGETFNVIPDRADLEGTVRCYGTGVRADMPDLISQIARGIAAAHGCTARVAYTHLVPAVRNEPRAAGLVRRVGARLVGPERVRKADLTMAAEDFALYQERVPGAFFWLGSDGPYGLHHPSYCVDERCIAVGVKLMTEIAMEAGAEPW